MNALKHLPRYVLVFSVAAFVQPLQGRERASAGISTASLPDIPAAQDGQHAFDFEIGPWKVHVSRLMRPLTGSTTWVQYDGTHIIRKVWNGRANLGELEIDGPAGHIEGLALRLYNPETRQWSESFASSRDGRLGQAMVGEFKNGRGEFFDQETLNGRTVLARSIYSDITPTSYRIEQAFSNDGGKTWEVNWVATHTRMKTEDQ